MSKQLVVLLLALPLLAGCATVRFNQKKKLAYPSMVFDYDAARAEMRGHVLSPREVSLGGFASGGAGGCGCN